MRHRSPAGAAPRSPPLSLARPCPAPILSHAMQTLPSHPSLSLPQTRDLKECFDFFNEKSVTAADPAAHRVIAARNQWPAGQVRRAWGRVGRGAELRGAESCPRSALARAVSRPRIGPGGAAGCCSRRAAPPPCHPPCVDVSLLHLPLSLIFMQPLFKDVMETYFGEMSRVSFKLLEAFCGALHIPRDSMHHLFDVRG